MTVSLRGWLDAALYRLGYDYELRQLNPVAGWLAVLSIYLHLPAVVDSNPHSERARRGLDKLNKE
jgi:hypothetical protein